MPEVRNVSQADLYKIARLAAKIYADSDKSLMSSDEREMVAKLEATGFLKEESLSLGFTGDDTDDEIG